MKIIVATRDLDFGVGSVVKNELKALDKNRAVEKVIVIGPKKLEGYSKKISFQVLNNQGKYFITKEPNFAFRVIRKIEEAMKKEEINRIYTHFPIYAKKFNAELVSKLHTLHRSILQNHPKTPKLIIGAIFHKLYSKFDERTIKFADKVLFVSKKSMSDAKKFYPQYAKKFHYEPNKADKEKFYKVSNKKKEELKKILDFKKEDKNILFVGRLDPMKGIKILIRAIQKINDPKVKLIIIGDGPLKKEVQRYGFIRYLGKVPNEELYKYYNAADLFILPSLYENMPITILEAKSCGCKILASNVGDNEYILNRDQIYNNLTELKAKIEKIIK